MSRYDDQMGELRETARRVSDLMHDRDAGEWADEGRARTLAVLAYTQATLEASEALLVSDEVAASVTNALTQYENNPQAGATSNVDQWSSSLLDAVGQLPVARGRDLEQAVTDAAKTFQRSASQRLRTVRTEAGQARDEVASVRQEVESAREELKTVIEERKAEVETEVASQQAAFEQKLTEYEQQRAKEETAFTTLRSSQETAFEEAETRRKAATTDRVDQADSDFSDLLAKAKGDVDERVGEIRRMEHESAQMVGAIGLAGTAERYGEEFDEQRSIADRWRLATVVLALLAVGGAVYAISEDTSVETFVGKLALSVIFGGVAAYAARQSSYHRGREKRARDLQLELTAFSPFIEPLSDEQREEERVVMTRKTFGKTTTTEAHEEDPGPNPLSALLRRKEQDPDA
ncbi:MAG: hypothetical protein M3356_05105 [Actinomycetota bacterium]|nr:hypothetical protein [Actinomycetota bacterium]